MDINLWLILKDSINNRFNSPYILLLLNSSFNSPSIPPPINHVSKTEAIDNEIFDCER